MLAKCANPLCAARFRYLGEGRLFRLDALNRPQSGSPSAARVEYYWLCADCSLTWTVIRQNGKVAVERRHPELPQFCTPPA